MSQPPLSPKPKSRKSETTSEKGIQTRPEISNRVQATLKTQSIKALRGTIQALQGVLEKLEAEPPAGTLQQTATGATQSFFDKLQNWWSAALRKIRSLLPKNLSSKLSNTALTTIIAGISLIVIWTTSALLSGKPPEVVSVSAFEQVSTPTITTPPELTAPAAPEPIEVTPLPQLEPTPTPTLELTPEQNLIASIENQVAEISARYADGLIQSIQVNFQGSHLTIKVGNDWYNLKQSQQDNLAARMLERSKELDFSHLEITDPQGTVLARSPIVGTDIVILKRQLLSDYESVVRS